VSETYIGSELEIFQHAKNWKAYYGGIIRPYLGERVLEVGAGIGATTAALIGDAQTRWVCLEPDAVLTRGIERRKLWGELPETCEIKIGTTADVVGEKFDSILYLDVLEHIEDDRAELARAAQLLRPLGRLIVLAPAHDALYTAFDRAIGHHRRYDKRSLAAVMPPTLERVTSKYLDSAGIALSFGNRLFLRSPMPTHKQIAIWDKLVIPISRRLDRLLRFHAGKSLLEVRRRL
jgi:2-polyprenyl-3-methyl-5-hydroxy-6-metoxy-1,4-benzoquinol methylase